MCMFVLLSEAVQITLQNDNRRLLIDHLFPILASHVGLNQHPFGGPFSRSAICLATILAHLPGW